MSDEYLFHSNSKILRHPENPILTRHDVPYPATLVFNAGVTFYSGQYVCVFRNDFGEWGNPELLGTNLGLATSSDGIHWKVNSKPIWTVEDVIKDTATFFSGLSNEREILRAYDPRLTIIEDQCYMCFALDTCHGLRGGIARTTDFHHFEVLNLSTPDNRNMVLFPERINGKYFRLERPMPVYSRQMQTHFDIWGSDSSDLKYWGNHQGVLWLEQVPFAKDKIGPSAPPVKTKYGWLTLFHAVDRDPKRGKNGWEEIWQKRYSVGVMLLDLENPSKVIGISKEPLMVPEYSYEKNGFRNDVLFPGGMILEKSGEVKIYYGAADTVECLATIDVNDLLSLCINRSS
jgi:beta-1,4-mannooligosaccharide/beta-1,4-mannosyl-N-acetylglucosamine phosphorylase